MSVETDLLREMIRGDLELAFEHLNNDLPGLAAHELRKALERVAQIEALQNALPVKATQQPLLTLPPDEQQNH